MKNPLGFGPGKGNQGTTRGKEKNLLTSVGMLHDRPPSGQQISDLNTIGQYIDINNIMPWLDVCFYGRKLHTSVYF